MYYVGILTANKTLQVLQSFFALNNELGRGWGWGAFSRSEIHTSVLKVSFLLQTFFNRYLNSLQ